jgi:antitoxin FitA
MGQILIRNLDDAVIADIKRGAKIMNISAEEEARRRLTASVPMDREAIIARMNAIAEAIGPQSGPSSTELLRMDRDRDDLL